MRKIPEVIVARRAKYKKISCYYYYAETCIKLYEAAEKIAGDEYFIDETLPNMFSKSYGLSLKYTEFYFKHPEDALQFKLQCGEYTICPNA